ncbi:MAG: hypothetical protein JXR83_04290 [Deltaproteobacteria bacterium]|nr:hypothetical protein [Deltaproteobacteria bacterium]
MKGISRWATLLAALAMTAGCPPCAFKRPAAAARPDSGSKPGGPAPEIAIPEDHFDSGKVKQGEVVKHTFVVQNRGLGTLNIEKVKGS